MALLFKRRVVLPSAVFSILALLVFPSRVRPFTTSIPQDRRKFASPVHQKTTRHEPNIGHAHWQSGLNLKISRKIKSRRTATVSAVEQAGLERNMFRSSLYTKPIVLLGLSGSGNEMSRLAKSLRIDLANSDGLTNNVNEGVVYASDIGSLEDLLGDVDSSKLAYPNIVLLDFDIDDYSEYAKALYGAGLLCIYVNVDPDESGMSETSQRRKLDVEDKVFVRYSDYELCIRDEGLALASEGDSGWSHIEWELNRLMARATLQPSVPGDETNTSNSARLTMGLHTFFLSLSFPDITEVQPYVQEMCRDVDSMEYRTDLLNCRESRFDVIYGLQLLRKYCRPHAARAPGLPFGHQVIDDAMPTVYTVRTRNQAGTYPDDETGIIGMFNLLEWGLRSGVEVLDVESAWDFSKTNDLLSLAEARYSSQILGSHHVVGKEVSLQDAVMIFRQCALNGRAHGAKVVLTISDDERDRMAYEAAMIAASLAEEDGDPVIPNISLILGEVGQFSRVINLPFTPVTHDSLPFKAAPGQMTSNEIMATRLLTKILQPKRYAILGHNIAYSVSPQMQGSAFAVTRLPHEYYRADVEDVHEFVESDFFKADNFGGCSVTVPHKQAIIPYVDVMSDAAKEIGSVNTLIVREEVENDSFERVVYGDNTDWKGVYNPLKRRLGLTSTYDYALIVGAGGTARAAAYAAEKLGLRQLYYNRTPAKAADLAERFGGAVVSDLERDGEESLGALLEKAGGVVRAIISTLPAAAEVELPEWMLASGTDSALPIVFDVNYKPYHTKLLIQAEKAGCNIVRGSEMLWEQGVGQFELWTERTAPYRVMKDVVLENCLPVDEGMGSALNARVEKNAMEVVDVSVVRQDS